MTLFCVGGRAAAVMAALLIGTGCGGEEAFQARPVDGGAGGMTGSGGTGGMDAAGTTGTAGIGGAGGVEMPGTGGSSAGGGAGAAGAGGIGGTTGTGGVAGSAGTGGSGGTTGAGGGAGSAGMGGATGSGGTTVILNCPTMIEAALETTDPTQTGRHSRVSPASACGVAKSNPGNMADATNPHLFNVYTFVNPTGLSACFTFTLTYDGTNDLQRYLTAYTTYDPANIGLGYLGDVGGVLTSPQTMSITVPAASSIDVVIVAIDSAPLGIGPYTLRCDTGGGGGAGGGGGSIGASP